MQSIYRVPVERLSNPLPVVPPQQKQRKHAVIDSVGIDRHAGARASPQQKRCSQCNGAGLKRLNFAHHTVSRVFCTTTAPM
jgi:hypothetical protein